MESLNCAPTSIVNNTISDADNSSITLNNNTQAPSQNAAQDSSPKSKKRNIDEVTSDEIDALFNSVQESGEGEEEIDPVYLRGQPAAAQRPPTTHYIVNENINVSQKFYDYQCQSKDIMENQGFVIETSVFEILSLSSILLLKPRQYSSFLRQHFTAQQLKNVIENDCKTGLLGKEDISCDQDLLDNVDKIIKTPIKNENRVEAIKSLSLVLPCKDQSSARIVCMLIDMILTLPMNEIRSSSGEINLCAQ